MSGEPIDVKSSGINELVQSLRGVDDNLLHTMQNGMIEAGDLVRDDARKRFKAKFSERDNLRSALSIVRTAEHMGTQSRGITSGHNVRVTVGQELRKVSGKRPDWGGEQMKFGLIPAWDAKHEEATEIVAADVFGLLKRHGF